MSYSDVSAGERPWLPSICLGLSSWRPVKRGFIFVASMLSLSFILYSSGFLNGPRMPVHLSPFSSDYTLRAHDIVPGDRKLVILLPADNSSPDLCKVIASAVALGYPAPVIVNWKQDFHTNEEGIGPSQLGKISGTLDYLNWAAEDGAPAEDRLNDDDLVLMLDAYDVWMQLPPSVLIERYFKANEQANSRLARSGLGLRASNDSHASIEQTIVVSAQKACVSPRDSVSDFHCKDVPESTLAPDVYGIVTDHWKWKYMRPRWINSGSFMGPAGDMRRLFTRVRDEMTEALERVEQAALEEKAELGGDQGLFMQVFGEQELWRRGVYQDRSPVVEDGGLRAKGEEEDDYEFHLGLDYSQELFYPTCQSDFDGYFTTLDNLDDVCSTSARVGVSTPRISGVPLDIKAAKAPFSALNKTSTSTPAIRRLSWGEVPLYTDFWTTAVPVALHHNAWRDGLKHRRVTWWDKTWFFPHLRALLEAHASPQQETQPLGEVPAQDGSSLRIWPSDRHRSMRLPMVFKHKGKGGSGGRREWILQPTAWHDVCASREKGEEVEHPWYEEVLRDGKGPL